MASTTHEKRPPLSPAIKRLLGSLRARVRAYVWAEGSAAALAWLGVAFWASLAIDWFFEPPVVFRLAVLAAAGCVFAAILVRMIGLRAFVPLTDRNMAMVLERRFSKLDDSLLTAVALLGEESDALQCDREMLLRTSGEAAERIENLRLGAVFDFAPLGRALAAAGLLAASVALFAALMGDAFSIWARRNLRLADDLWPRQSHLELVGFRDGVIKVARGADLRVMVRADASYPRVPQSVEIRYRNEGGARNRARMDREGNAVPGQDAWQEYSYAFQDILAPISFDVIDPETSGDRVYNCRIEVVENPVIEMSLECHYPAYMDREDRVFPVTGIMQIPLGTELTLRAKANKELARVQVDTSCGDKTGAPQFLEGGQLSGDRRGFACRLDPLCGDATLLFTLYDADGIRSREPVRLALATVADEAPRLAVRLDGIGSAITPEARLPLVGQITDDYGIDRLWVEVSVDQGEQTACTLLNLPKHPSVHDLENVALECRGLHFRPGQKLLVGAKASDLFDFQGKKANVGMTERWQLEVVTAEQLRSMLEARELVLRQRFEQILSEVTETRDLLLKVSFDPAADKSSERRGAEPEDAGKGAAGGEPGDAPRGGEKAASPVEHLERQTLRVQQSLQNSRKNEHEIAGVADAFDDIRKQLVNNRIDTEELKLRIEGGICKPLREISGEMFPAFEKRLERLQENVGDPQRGPGDRDRARKQADDIILAMRHVLDRMIELEDFNEALEILRSIIKRQEQLDESTRQRHKETIRSLMED